MNGSSCPLDDLIIGNGTLIHTSDDSTGCIVGDPNRFEVIPKKNRNKMVGKIYNYKYSVEKKYINWLFVIACCDRITGSYNHGLLFIFWYALFYL